MRRTLLWLVLAAIVCGTAWTFFEWLKPAAARSDPWKAIPSESALVIELSGSANAWSNFTGASQLWAAVSDRQGAAALDSLVAGILGTNASEPPLFALLRRGDGVGWLGVIAGPSDHRISPWPRLLGIVTGNSSDAAGRTFNPDETFPAKPSPDLSAVTLVWTKGLLLIGSDAGIIEEAQLQIKSGTSLFNDSAFARAHGTLGDGADAHVLVQPARLARLLGGRLERTTADALAWPEGWAALDARSKPDALLLSGLLASSASNAALQALNKQGTGHNSVLRVLPASTHVLRIQHISDPQRWSADHGMAMEGTDLNSDALFSWVQGSVAFATIGQNDSVTWDQLVLQAGDPAAAEKALLGLCQGSSCDTINYRGIRIASLPIQDPFSGWLGAPFDRITSPFWCLLGDKVVMTKDRSALEKAIDAWTDGTTLSTDPRASAFFESIPAETGLTFWSDPGTSNAWLRQHLSVQGVKQWEQYASVIAQLSGFSVQVSPGQHGFNQIDIRLQHGGAASTSGAVEVADNALWSIALKVPPAQHPFLALDHTNGTRYVLVQDTDNGLTAISSTGKVMWTRALDGPILGEIEQVDRFKNGKLQLLLNTAQRVYMIDRNGKDVGGWPVVLKEKASAPLAVFDYDGNKDYRILLPTEEAGIINLMPDGKPVTGWAPTHMPAVATGPVRHLRVKNNDYLLVTDHKGNVQLLDRKGLPRYTAKLHLPAEAIVLDVRMGISIGTCALLWTDSSGALKSGTIDGAVEDLAPGAEGAISVTDLQGNGSLDIIRTWGDSITATGNSKTLFARSFPCALESPATVVQLAKDRPGIAVVCATGERLWLLDADGTMLPDLRTAGKYFTIGDINKDGSSEVIIISSAGSMSAIQLSAVAQ